MLAKNKAANLAGTAEVRARRFKDLVGTRTSRSARGFKRGRPCGNAEACSRFRGFEHHKEFTMRTKETVVARSIKLMRSGGVAIGFSLTSQMVLAQDAAQPSPAATAPDT